MSYDKFLVNYMGLKSVNNFKFIIKNLEGDLPFLVAKFSMKFLENLNNNNSFKKNNIKLKFIINTHDCYLIQFFDLYMQQINKFGESQEITESKKFPINEEINLNLSDLNIEDEMIVK